MQVILKLYEETSSSKIKLFKNPNQPGQMEWSQFSIKILRVTFGKSILNNSNWDKISEGIIKNPYLEQSETLFEG